MPRKDALCTQRTARTLMSLQEEGGDDRGGLRRRDKIPKDVEGHCKAFGVYEKGKLLGAF